MTPSVFRITVAVKSGQTLTGIFVRAEGPTEAVAVARAHGLIEDGEVATATRINGKLAAGIDFGRSNLAVGEPAKR